MSNISTPEAKSRLPESEDRRVTRPVTPKEPPPPRQPPPSVEDAGTQALAEALRSSFQIIKFLMIGLVLVFISSGVFTVKPNQRAIILRFGKPVGVGADQLLKPGLQWAFPYPIDEIVRIPIGQTHSVTSSSGWYATTPEQELRGEEPQALPYLRPGVDGYTLSADGNIIHAKANLKYRILPSAADQYAFDFANIRTLLQDILDNALFYASSRFPADAAILEQFAFRDLVLKRVNQAIIDYQLGITVESLDLQTSAPLDVRNAFNEVTKAQQAASAKVNEAQAYARGITNTALGQSTVLVSQALTRSNELVKTVAAEADRFSDLLPSYERNPLLFEQRLQTETNQRVMTNAQEKIFVPTAKGGEKRELRILLSREPPKSKAPPSGQP